MEGIPHELTSHILSYLSVKEVLACSQVSHNLYKSANDEQLWRQRFQALFPSIEPEDEKTTWKQMFKRMSQNVLLIYHLGYGEPAAGLEDTKRYLTKEGIRITDTYGSSERKFVMPEKVKELLNRNSVVMFWTNSGSAEQYGDLLTYFVESGKSVILAVFANTGKCGAPGGLWAAKNYNPIIPNTQDDQDALGSILLPSHPIMKGIKNCVFSYSANCDVHPEATLIAKTKAGRPLVAEMKISPTGENKKSGLVISIGIFPPSNGSGDGGWQESPDNDVDKLFANACRYALAHSN